MNARTKLVLTILKPKAKSFGFSAAELQNIAKQIADGLTSEEDASDDDVNAEIEKAVDLAIPYLKLAQSSANRVIEEQRKKQAKKTKDDDDDDDIDDDSNEPTTGKQSKEMKALMTMLAKLEAKVDTLSQDKVTTNYKKQLEEALKDAGKFGQRILKDFDKLKFEDAESFQEYLEEVKTDFEDYKQDLADKGLKGMVGAGNNAGGKGANEKLSEKEVEDLASLY